MASSSGASSGSSTLLPNSGSEEDLQAIMDQRKRKRMLSNRESARRSRMRKQNHLDDLMAQVAQLRKENGQILAALCFTTQNYLGVETENSVLRTQGMELSNRLQSLNEILLCMAQNMNSGLVSDGIQDDDDDDDDEFTRSWSLMFMNQSIMASADMFQ